LNNIEEKNIRLVSKEGNIKNEILEIKLKGINNIIDMSYMFAGCPNLYKFA